MAEELGDEPMTVGDLIECDALAVRLNDPSTVWLNAVEDGHVVTGRCESGALAAAVRALADPRVRVS